MKPDEVGLMFDLDLLDLTPARIRVLLHVRDRKVFHISQRTAVYDRDAVDGGRVTRQVRALLAAGLIEQPAATWGDQYPPYRLTTAGLAMLDRATLRG